MEFGFDAATARPVEVPVGVAYNCGGSLYIGPSQNLLDSGIGRTGSRDKRLSIDHEPAPTISMKIEIQ
jgi:hypothetical protein